MCKTCHLSACLSFRVTLLGKSLAAAQAAEQDDETVLVQHLNLPHSLRQTSRQMIGFAHKSISADNSSHFLLTNKVTRFKIALTQYGIVQVKTWQEMAL